MTHVPLSHTVLRRSVLVAAILVLLLFLLIAHLQTDALQAATLQPGSTVTQNVVLNQDLDCRAVTNCLIVGVDDIVIDGNGHALIGPGEPTESTVWNAGIEVLDREKIILKNFSTITGFDIGIRVKNSSGVTIADSTLDGNFYEGIQVNFSQNTVVHRTVIRHSSVGMTFDGSVQFSDNEVTDTTFAFDSVNRNFDSWERNRFTAERSRVGYRNSRYLQDISIPKRLVQPGDTASFSLSLMGLDGVPSPDTLYTIRTVPEATVQHSQEEHTVSGSFPITQNGYYQLIIQSVDPAGNTTERTYHYISGPTEQRTQRYYFTTKHPFFSMPAWQSSGFDNHALMLTPPDDIGSGYCGGWVQVEPNEPPNVPPALLTGIDINTWYHTRGYSRYIQSYFGAQRYVNMDSFVNVQLPYDGQKANVTQPIWGTFPLRNLNWMLESPQSWLSLSVKMSGALPEWFSGPVQGRHAYVDFHYLVPTILCGNSIMETDEQCDDGNTTDGDGCSARCILEAVDPAIAMRALALDHLDANGDGVLTQEEVDQTYPAIQATILTSDGRYDVTGDGAMNQGDLAIYQAVAGEYGVTLRTTVCGDGILQHGEQCDDRNKVNGDGCSAQCVKEQCGNGLREAVFAHDATRTTAQSIESYLESVRAGALDVDGNGRAEALTDGILIQRYLSNVRGEDLTHMAVDRTASRTSPDDILAFLDANAAAYDVDGNGAGVVSEDGILIMRFLFRFTGTALVGEECDDGNTANGDGCDPQCNVEATDVAAPALLQRETNDSRASIPVESRLHSAAPEVFTIDNGDAAFAQTSEWTHQTGQGYQSDVHYVRKGKGSAKARWIFSVVPGTYTVAATWSPYQNRATNTPFSIYDGSRLLGTVRVNQELKPADFTADGAAWKTLGTFTVTGNTMMIQLSNNANEYVIADAIRIERK